MFQQKSVFDTSTPLPLNLEGWGCFSDEIRHMSEDDLLDMDYFLNEDDFDDEDFPDAEGFYIF